MDFSYTWTKCGSWRQQLNCLHEHCLSLSTYTGLAVPIDTIDTIESQRATTNEAIPDQIGIASALIDVNR